MTRSIEKKVVACVSAYLHACVYVLMHLYASVCESACTVFPKHVAWRRRISSWHVTTKTETTSDTSTCLSPLGGRVTSVDRPSSRRPCTRRIPRHVSVREAVRQQIKNTHPDVSARGVAAALLQGDVARTRGNDGSISSPHSSRAFC